MKSTIFLIALLFSYASMGQDGCTISGFIKDGSIGEDLIGATIYKYTSLSSWIKQ